MALLGHRVADVRLYELAYCCHVFALFEGYDRASVKLREATGDAVNPEDENHQAALFKWLRQWGCRQFAVADEDVARQSLSNWWSVWGKRLPENQRTLDQLEEETLNAIASAYEDLRGRQASWQRRASGQVPRTFGPTGAAKTLYAIRPNACSPWDEPIRAQFRLGPDGEGYRRHLVRIRAELAEASADVGPNADVSRLPPLVDRPNSSPVKLVDEHDWARFTRGVEPPSLELLERWVVWARVAATNSQSKG
jgi:hypothetical protein